MHPDAPARRITTWLAILGYALVASGLPLPLGGGVASDGRVATSAKRLSVKDRSRPFPCMDSPCGCDTADRCFTSCCCRAPAETLAWARAHGVEPGLLVALERRVGGGQRPVERASSPTGKASCCVVAASRSEPSCCPTAPRECEAEAAAVENVRGREIRPDGQASAAPRRAAADAALTGAHEPPAEDEPSPRPRARSVTLRAMLACGGIVAEWFAVGAALPPPRVEVFFVMLPVDETIVADAVGAGLRAAPDAPPPRAA